MRAPAVELSVVVPTFNEADNVGMVVERLDACLGDHRWEVIFVDDGRVVAQGTHQELLAEQGAYYRLYSLSYQAIEEEQEAA